MTAGPTGKRGARGAVPPAGTAVSSAGTRDPGSDAPRAKDAGALGSAGTRGSTVILYSDDVFLPAASGGVERRPAAVVVTDGRIADVLVAPKPDALPPSTRRLEGALVPGFVELQNNGCYGVDVARDDDALEVMARRLPEQGVTTVFPTVVCSPTARYVSLFDAVRTSASGGRLPGADIPGLHVEGPFFAPSRRGAHDPNQVQPLTPAALESLLERGEGALRLLTLAPELEGAPEAIRRCLDRGVVPSAGHTEATREDMERALEAGLPLVTHLTNAMSKDVVNGPAAAVLAHPSVRAGVIVDGIHVKPPLLRTLYEGLGPSRMVLVTDAAPPAGMPEGEYTLGELPVVLEGGAVRLKDHAGTLAGSALTMDEAVRNAVTLLDITLEDAVRMASATPADVMGLADRGAIEVGRRADLVVLDTASMTVKETLVEGVTRFRRS